MVYTSRAVYDYKGFYSSTDTIITHDDIITHSETNYTKVLEFELINKIHPDSQLELYYQLRNEVNLKTAWALWYLNGVAYTGVDTVTGIGWVAQTDDITTALNRGDILALYSRTDVGGQVSTQTARIRGTSSPFSINYIKP